MNQLSWLLYIGNVAGNLGGFFVFFSIVLCVYTLVQVIICYLIIDNFDRWDHESLKHEIKEIKASRVRSCLALIIVFFLCVSAALCPSQDTVYAIAASEVGQEALKTPLAQKTEQALEAWLSKQIANDTTKSTQ
jgi:hypothetical protein